MTDTSEQQITAELTFSQFEALRAIVRGEITMTVSEPGTWRRKNGKHGYVVTSTMRSLLERKLVIADATFTDGVRGCRITAAGYAALSRAVHHKPTKKRR